MNAGQFIRKRERMLSEQGRSNAWRKRALARLISEARAEPQTTGRRVLSYRLPDGQHVCVKQRFRSEQRAVDAMAEMRREIDGRRKPIRAYPCYFCNGWHITSQA
jgi:hypothetical protein